MRSAWHHLAPGLAGALLIGLTATQVRAHSEPHTPQETQAPQEAPTEPPALQALRDSQGPQRAMRALEALGARIAAGERAPDQQAIRLREIATAFRAEPARVWADARNAQALAGFLFNGGDVATVRAILSVAVIADGQKALLDGALAHAEGRTDAARGLLSIDAHTLSADLGAHLALVQATQLSATDAKAALDRLDLARLLMPGSLVEEAALRRALFLLTAGDDVAAWGETVRRYRARFARSAFADNFERRVALSVVARWWRADEASASVLTAVIDGADPASRRALWLASARHALMQGAMAAATAATTKADAYPLTSDHDRGAPDLYRTIAAMLRGDLAAAARMKTLADIPADDRDLWRAALMIADNVRAPMPASSHASMTRDISRENPASGTDATIAHATDLLGDAR